ncbi:MAG: hypothetical protein JNK64_13385 [Myxococcales bacterium]|nr:hypothetical protein [Myxococcales bacterium]
MERLCLALPLLLAACGQIVAITADAPEGGQDAARSPDGGAPVDAPAAPPPDASPAPVDGPIDAPGGYVLTVVLDGAGSGDVKSVPDGIACGPRCAETFPPNTAVALTAAPHAGAFFAGWNEPGCGMATTCTVIVTAPREILAKFEVAP